MASVLTDAGRAWIIDKIDGLITQTEVPKYIGWGTGAGTAAASDTTLFSEASEARVVGVRTQPTSTLLRVVGTLVAASAKTITNAGLFTNSTGSTLIVKGDHGGQFLQINDAIEYTFELELL